MSNIAWDITEDEEVSQLLCRYSIDAVDVAPGKYFPDPEGASDRDIAHVSAWWTKRGIEITGMQALLFGTNGLNLFGPAEVQNAMLRHLTAVCRIGGRLGATRLVFGSPKNRDRSGLTDQKAIDVAVPFFRRLGDIAESHGVVVCLEPTPRCYGANFMTTTAETVRLVQYVGHTSIKVQLDTGALTINGDDAAAVLDSCAQSVGHVHASEPGLLPIGDGSTDHGNVSAALEKNLPGHVVSIEMLATANEPHVVSIERALKSAINSYRIPKGVGL
ncbi:sugar phosphate isomerase/epimerase [Acidithiobacillus sp.]|jgi:sugar phosphate isomerase/epimerase|uniref:sugar phosphate isomerase/epimerase family protein n=1 Tax=Acidithiobacillus sp. TaxID=1872118 RepID=UPI0025BE5D87|nr:sugar phosphate isomerase/epimerase family protein [Acidithiobacillus sp.]MCK9187974.1 sugar phosphate isomerase/epimerase [Acidithiobacillus sp.]MCK9359933.1 sugar phosphate isomerase/epimerase [Acidithiobacillus sp.]